MQMVFCRKMLHAAAARVNLYVERKIFWSLFSPPPGVFSFLEVVRAAKMRIPGAQLTFSIQGSPVSCPEFLSPVGTGLPRQSLMLLFPDAEILKGPQS
jgi:hypothetical protein